MRKAITPETEAALVAYFRATPVGYKFTEAAKVAGCSAKYARKAFAEVQKVIEEEQARARALLAEQEAEVQRERERRGLVPELAALDAAAARAKQGAAARGLLDLVESARKLGERIVRHGERLAVWLEAQPVDAKMTTSLAISQLTRAAGFLKALGESVDRAVRLERLVLGEPDQVIGIQNMPSPEELRAEMTRLNQDFEKLETMEVIGGNTVDPTLQ